MARREGQQVINSGTTATVTNGAGTLFFDMPSLTASFTLTMSSAPNDQDIIAILPGGTITTGTVVTALTLSPNSGQTIIGAALTTLLVGTVPMYQYRNLTSQWYRIQ